MEIPEFIDSKFRLAILAAKRAKQIVGGGKKRIESSAQNPLTTAIEEIYKGKISFTLVEDSPDIEMITGSVTEDETSLDASAKDFLLGTSEPLEEETVSESDTSPDAVEEKDKSE